MSKDELKKVNKNLLVDYIHNLDENAVISSVEIKSILQDLNDKFSKLNDRLIIKENVIEKLSEDNTKLRKKIELIENAK